MVQKWSKSALFELMPRQVLPLLLILLLYVSSVLDAPTVNASLVVRTSFCLISALPVQSCMREIELLLHLFIFGEDDFVFLLGTQCFDEVQ